MKKLIIMTHYVCVGNQGSQRARTTLEAYVTTVNKQTKDDPQYRFKHFIMAVKETEQQRIECIFQGVN